MSRASCSQGDVANSVNWANWTIAVAMAKWTSHSTNTLVSGGQEVKVQGQRWRSGSSWVSRGGSWVSHGGSWVSYLLGLSWHLIAGGAQLFVLQGVQDRGHAPLCGPCHTRGASSPNLVL